MNSSSCFAGLNLLIVNMLLNMISNFKILMLTKLSVFIRDGCNESVLLLF